MAEVPYSFQYAPSFAAAKEQWLAGGRTEEGLQALVEVVEAGRASGRLRDDIPCDEFRARFIDMAQQVYVNHEPVQERPLDDWELGRHVGQCHEAQCQTLNVLYWTVLRRASSDQAEDIDHLLQDVRDGIELDLHEIDLDEE